MKQMFFTTIVIFALSLLYNVAYADSTYYFTGHVIDAKTKEPMPGVVVEIIGTSFGSTTDLDGRYLIMNVPKGTYTIQIRAFLYYTKTIVALTPDSIDNIDSLLNAKLNYLKENGYIVDGKIEHFKRGIVFEEARKNGRFRDVTLFFSEEAMNSFKKHWNHEPQPRLKNPFETQTIHIIPAEEIEHTPKK